MGFDDAGSCLYFDMFEAEIASRSFEKGRDITLQIDTRASYLIEPRDRISAGGSWAMEWWKREIFATPSLKLMF
jgi:hypothetical protein